MNVARWLIVVIAMASSSIAFADVRCFTSDNSIPINQQTIKSPYHFSERWLDIYGHEGQDIHLLHRNLPGFETSFRLDAHSTLTALGFDPNENYYVRFELIVSRDGFHTMYQGDGSPFDVVSQQSFTGKNPQGWEVGPTTLTFLVRKNKSQFVFTTMSTGLVMLNRLCIASTKKEFPKLISESNNTLQSIIDSVARIKYNR